MKRSLIYVLVPTLFLLGTFACLLIAGARDASAVEDQVLRFHVVGASNSPEDQQIKLKVRDGVFTLIRELFADCADRKEALAVARENAPLLQEEAARILEENGVDQGVTVEIGERFFPTKDYGSFSFPAGSYQAVSIRLGEAKGENFWCVLYPALCLSPAVAEGAAAEELTAVVGEERTAFLQKSGSSQKIKFALAEWWGGFLEKIGEIKNNF